MIEDKKEKRILHLKPNYCEFSAFVVDPALVIMGFIFTLISILLYTWWSILLAIVLFVFSLGMLKSLFLKEVYLYEDKVILKWYLLGRKVIYIDEIKEVRNISAVWLCWKYTLLKRQPFDYESIWVIVNESILGEERSIRLQKEIKKLLGEDK